MPMGSSRLPELRDTLALPEAAALLNEDATGVHRLVRAGEVQLAGRDARFGVTSESVVALLTIRVAAGSVPHGMDSIARDLVAGNLTIPGVPPSLLDRSAKNGS